MRCPPRVHPELLRDCQTENPTSLPKFQKMHWIHTTAGRWLKQKPYRKPIHRLVLLSQRSGKPRSHTGTHEAPSSIFVPLVSVVSIVLYVIERSKTNYLFQAGSVSHASDHNGCLRSREADGFGEQSVQTAYSSRQKQPPRPYELT